MVAHLMTGTLDTHFLAPWCKSYFIIVTEDGFHAVIYFHVEDFNEWSNHTPLLCKYTYRA